MGWFNKRLQAQSDLVEDNSKVEIVAHQEATKREIEQVKEVNQNLNDLFAANGFTLKIYLAAGGRREHLTTQAIGESKEEWIPDPDKENK